MTLCISHQFHAPDDSAIPDGAGKALSHYYKVNRLGILQERATSLLRTVCIGRDELPLIDSVCTATHTRPTPRASQLQRLWASDWLQRDVFMVVQDSSVVTGVFDVDSPNLRSLAWSCIKLCLRQWNLWNLTRPCKSLALGQTTKL